MKAQINGIEITPNIIEVLESWYNCHPDDEVQPIVYTKWLSKIQDFLTRIWVDKFDNSDDISILKDCVNCIITIKDDFQKLIPDKNE